MRLALLLLPLALLAALIGVFAISMNRDPGLVRSVMIDRPVPNFTLPPVDGLEIDGIDSTAIRGEVTVLNVFASWCIPCRDEHPFLESLKAETGVRFIGINQKDAPENAVAFLAELGNPYDLVGADSNGRASIELGVYGVPETFVVNPAGLITYKHIGPITDTTYPDLRAAIEKARTDFRSAPGAEPPAAPTVP